MKRIVSSIAFGILITFGAIAQEKQIFPSGDTRENFKFGFKAGVKS